LDDARLRRAQALAATSTAGLEISRTLIATKIRGQQSNLSELGTDPVQRRDVALADECQPTQRRRRQLEIENRRR